MSLRSLSVILITCLLSTLAWAQLGAPGFPGGQALPPEEPEFPGRRTYSKRLEAAEAAYKAEIAKARAAYVQDIKNFQMRATMMPAASQRLDAEVKRVENLPDPIVIPEPIPKN